MSLNELTSEAQFNEAIASTDLTIIVAGAAWCAPCRLVPSWVADCAEQHPSGVNFAKIDVDDLEDLAERLNPTTLPTFIAYRGGQELDRFSGGSKDRLIEMVGRHKQVA